MLDNILTTIRQIIKEKVDIMSKYWQVSIMIDMIHNKKDVIISAGTRFDKSLPY